eukprot:6653797-Prymnesium_polylepis.1
MSEDEIDRLSGISAADSRRPRVTSTTAEPHPYGLRPRRVMDDSQARARALAAIARLAACKKRNYGGRGVPNYR